MKVNVIGGGAAGLLTAAYSRIAGFDVTLITRTAGQAERILERGVVLERDGVYEEVTGIHSVPVNVPSDADVTIAAVKQFHLEPVLEEIADSGFKGPVFFLMNGMGHLEKASEKLTGPSIYGCVMTHGALRGEPHSVRHTGTGMLKAGPAGGEASPAADAFCRGLTGAGLNAALTHSIEQDMIDKLVVNAVINPLTAIYQVSNGSLCDNGELEGNARQLYAEVAGVLKGAPGWEFVEEVILGTSENHSSMCMDLMKGRLTEADAITGYVLKKAGENGTPVPVTEFVHRSVKGLERRGLRL
ncbi:2-dehydropantoate 2-reductase [Alteribacter natronophilus]|uniref:2-dehydropantoate 2-reductase n=1 Tax=Alteribacter natronophilus TaxID=2583810 RepID=UPI00148609F6|nr:2-dehydropantoate 2-reductase [Alteribacter natronophilus]